MKTIHKGLLFRFPRIAGILFILLISIFALDIFGQGYTFRQTVIGLFMHLIPTWILLIVLILSRKRYPLIGAIVFILFGVGYMLTNVITFIMSTGTGESLPYYLLTRPLIIALPALAVGGSFFANRREVRRHNHM